MLIGDLGLHGNSKIFSHPSLLSNRKMPQQLTASPDKLRLKHIPQFGIRLPEDNLEKKKMQNFPAQETPTKSTKSRYNNFRCYSCVVIWLYVNVVACPAVTTAVVYTGEFRAGFRACVSP